MADFRRRHDADAKLRSHGFSHCFTAVELQQDPRLNTGLTAGLIERAAGDRAGFAQHHDLCVQRPQLQLTCTARPNVPGR
ncbi:hypothetical protein D3C84_1171850 [compost metagenome]